MSEGPQMTSRIPCTKETHRRLQGYATGLGATFDDTLNFLLDFKIGDEKSYPSGEDDRADYLRWRSKKQSGSEKPNT